MSSPTAETRSALPAPKPRRPWRWPLRVIVGTLLVTTFISYGSKRVSVGPDSGSGLGGVVAAATAEPAMLRVATFNIHGGKGLDGRRDLGRTAQLLQSRRLDIIGLNEVHGTCLLTTQHQAARLGQMLGAGWVFAPTERRWWSLDFGNGLLSAHPVTHWLRVPLVRIDSKTFRNVVLGVVDCGGRRVHVLVTHIDRRNDADRAAQIEAVAALFLSLAEPAILMGDMNADADDPLLAPLTTARGVRDALGEVWGEATPRRIDWIFVRGLDVLDAGLDEAGVSDHPLVWAELAFPERPTGTMAAQPDRVQ